MTDSIGSDRDAGGDKDRNRDDARRLLDDALNRGPVASGDSGGAEIPSVESVARDFPQLEILGLLGRGGIGVVFKALQPGLGRIVALKVLHDRFAADPSFVERFTREARALAQLNHPNIVTLYDFGRLNGRFFVLMEYVDGLNLRQVLRAGGMNPAEALALIPKLCDALQYAHEEGIIHRDIKPENVLVDKRGRVKVADFGLAKLLGGAPAGQTLTDTGVVMGTPHYMAPEQMERPLEVDHRADVYALGVVFYEMLTGELPLGHFQPPSKKVDVDVRLDEVVLRAMEREPERRYQHVSDVKTGIESITSTPRDRHEAGHSVGGSAGSVEGGGRTDTPGIATRGHAEGVDLVTSETAPASVSKSAGLAEASRLDPLAVFSFLLLLTLPLSLALLRLAPSSSIQESEAITRVALIPVGLCGFAAILLGWIATVRICRSKGALRGLGFSLFGALLFPTVALCVVFSRLWRFIYAVAASMKTESFWGALGNPSYSTADHNSEIYSILAAACGLTVSILVCRMIVRSCAVPASADASIPVPTASDKGKLRWWPVLLTMTVLAVLVGLIAVSTGLVPGPRGQQGHNATPTLLPPNRGALFPMKWILKEEGITLTRRTANKTNWGAGAHEPGATIEEKYATTSGTVELSIRFLGNAIVPNRIAGLDQYQVTLRRSSPGQTQGTSVMRLDFQGAPVDVFGDGELLMYSGDSVQQTAHDLLGPGTPESTTETLPGIQTGSDLMTL